MQILFQLLRLQKYPPFLGHPQFPAFHFLLTHRKPPSAQARLPKATTISEPGRTFPSKIILQAIKNPLRAANPAVPSKSFQPCFLRQRCVRRQGEPALFQRSCDTYGSSFSDNEPYVLGFAPHFGAHSKEPYADGALNVLEFFDQGVKTLAAHLVILKKSKACASRGKKYCGTFSKRTGVCKGFIEARENLLWHRNTGEL